jgi:capsular exopolysaccharide synthesis family protein
MAATAVDERPAPLFTSPAPVATTVPVADEMPVITIPDVVESPESVEEPRPAAKPLTVAIGNGVRRTSGEVDEHLVSLITPDTFEADQYRVLRHTVEQRRRTAGLAIIGVTSAGPGDGKTTTAINLAGALAQDRASRVLLIDCDLRSSAMARRLGLADGRGLVQAIVDPMLTLDDAIRHLPRFNLDVMAAGFETASPYELLKSPRLGDLFEAARRRYDYVVVDTPPVVPFPDSRVLAKVIDGFLMVVSAHRTPRRLIDEALDVLPKEAIVGLVFNGDNQALSRSYHSYYGEDGGATADTTWRSSAKRAWARVGGA